MSKNKLMKHHQPINIFVSKAISYLLRKMAILIGATFSLAALLLWQELKLHE